MTKQELERFGALREAIADLDAEIVELEAALKALSGSKDVVQGSSPEFPFVLHSIPLEGPSAHDKAEFERVQRALGEARSRRVAKRREYVDEYGRLDDYLLTVRDPRMRQILSGRYVEGLTYLQIAQRLGRCNTADGVRMALARFLEGIEKDREG